MQQTTSKIKGLREPKALWMASLTVRDRCATADLKGHQHPMPLLFVLQIGFLRSTIEVRILIQVMYMAYEHHDHRSHRQR